MRICRFDDDRIGVVVGDAIRDVSAVLDRLPAVRWLVTADELGDPGALDLCVAVNGDVRQEANMRALVWNVPRLIAYASAAYTLHPGDVILTGTPEGVGPAGPGDVMSCSSSGWAAWR